MTLDIQVLRESFEAVKPRMNDLVTTFYHIFFTNHPEVRALFQKSDMNEQTSGLAKALSFFVANLENGDRLVAYLKDLGGRHVHYSVKAEHYEWVENSLLKAFAETLGKEWNSRLSYQWTRAFRFIVNTMQEGAGEVKTMQSLGPAHKALVIEKEKILQQGLQPYFNITIVLPEQIKANIREKVRTALKDAIEVEVKKVLAEEFEKAARDESIISSLKAG